MKKIIHNSYIVNMSDLAEKVLIYKKKMKKYGNKNELIPGQFRNCIRYDIMIEYKNKFHIKIG